MTFRNVISDTLDVIKSNISKKIMSIRYDRLASLTNRIGLSHVGYNFKCYNFQ